MSALFQHKLLFEKEIHELSAQLQPFDNFFDDDVLKGRQEQLNIISEEIKNIEICLVDSLSNNSDLESISDSKEYNKIATKLSNFQHLHKSVEEEIKKLCARRAQLYDAWKESYEKTGIKLVDAQKNLELVNDISKSLTDVYQSKSPPRNNILMLIHLHSQMNALLGALGYDRECSPFAAFQSAHNKELIDKNTYAALIA